MKKKTLMHGILCAFLCCFMILLFQTNVKAETGKYYIKVNKATNVVTVYTQDNKPYTAFVCSAGYATPLGTFYTPAKYTWWTLDGPVYGQYCTRISGGVLFHSVWYYSQNKTTQSYAQYNKLGTLASHGCVRLTTAASKWIYDNCPLQTKVTIFNGTAEDDPLGKPEAIKVSASVTMGWDPTDPDPNNTYNTKNTQPSIKVKSKKVTVQYKGKFTPVEMTAYDSAGNELGSAWIRADGSVNTKQMGSYPVVYALTDSFGRDTSVTVTYEVGDAKKATISGVKSKLTKEYNSTLNLRAGIKAKNSLGTVLTKKVIVKIKKPGTSVYKKVSADTLKLRYVGTYKIMYYLKNPTNKLVTKKYTTVTVKDTAMPVLSSTDDFAPMELAEGTASITYKKLVSGVTAKLVSGKNMTSKISVKVTDENGTTKTVAKGSSYTFKQAGAYTVTYYCTNTEKNLKTGNYMVAKQKRTLTVKSTQVDTITNTIEAPADETVTTTGAALDLLTDVKAVTVTVMTDNTQTVTETTEGIQYTAAYQPDAALPETDITPFDGSSVIRLDYAGIYKITYRYTDAQGNTAERVRTIIVAVE